MWPPGIQNYTAEVDVLLHLAELYVLHSQLDLSMP
jgi:hypothetical protein